MKRLLQERLSLSSKLRLKRAVFAPVVWAVRLAGRVYNFAVRLAGSAEANGVDLHRAFDVKLRPGPPRDLQPFGPLDFVLLGRRDAAERAADAARDSKRRVTASVMSHYPATVLHARERGGVAFQIIDAEGPAETARGDYVGPMPGVVRPLLEWDTRTEKDE